MSEQIDFFKSKYEGIFPYSQSENLLKEYEKIIKILNDLKERHKDSEFNLNPEIIKMIFEKYDETVDCCKVSDGLSYFLIVLVFKYKQIVRYKNIILKKSPYKFFYKENYYYCFEINSMKDYLNELLIHYEYYIELINCPFSGKRLKDIEQFLMLLYSEFKILISYQYKEIDYKNFDYNSIYELPDVITGQKLNLKLGHYVSLTEDDFNNYEYYDTEERKRFYKGFKNILYYKKVFGLCGPYGTGKTITLLKTIISERRKKYLYVNLETVNKLDNDELKKLLKYEVIKLFDAKVILLEDENNEEKKAYNNITQLIDNLEDKNIFQLLKYIILEMNNLKYYDSYFIIDQYCIKYNIDNKIKELIKTNKKSHIIVCSSMDNESIKFNISKCLEEDAIFPRYKLDFIYYFYVGSLIRLNTLSNYQGLINKQSQEFIKYLNDFGNIPLYYYSLKRTEIERGELDDFIYKEKENIIKEIKLFYRNNKKDKYEESYYMALDVLKTMSVINRREIFFFDELSEAFSKYPLEFLELKKETIKINDLKLYGLASNNQKINKFIKELEEINLVQTLKEKQNIIQNYILFFNEDNYCFNYISKLTENEKKKLGFNNVTIEADITIFYLDYLFPLIDEIFSFLTYQLISISPEYLFNQLPNYYKNEFLELIIREQVKNKKIFLRYYISYCETLDNFVPNEFFIQNYATRKTNSLRTFIDNKNQNSYNKKKLPDGNIFLTQSQFAVKYYDCALLVKCKDKIGYILMLFQISKRIINVHRYFREEHMLILNRIKTKLEKEYDIIINEGHFSYILLYEEPDNETINFCDNYYLNYFLFSINELTFMQLNNIIFSDKTLITRQFPVQSSFSILPEEKFIMENNKLIDYEFIKNFQRMLIYEDIEEGLKDLINKYFIINNDSEKDDKNEFYLFGNFDEIMKTNDSFCVWFNNNDLSLYYIDNDKNIEIRSNHSNKLSIKNYSLICSKYPIKRKEVVH